MKNQSSNGISARIKELRKEKGITQKQLSQLTGLGYNSIIGYENARREPNSKAMAALEEYFNVSGAFLRGETDVRDFLPNNERKQLTTAQTADELSDLLKKIQTTIKDISDEELEYTDGLLTELSQALNIQDLNKRAAALRLLHTTAHISNNFFSSYNHFTDKLSKEESANKALTLTVEKYNEALEQIKNLLEKI